MALFKQIATAVQAVKWKTESLVGKLFEKRHAGSWLGRSPFRKIDIETVEKWMQVRPGDQPGYPKDTIESFVGHSSMGLLCPLLKLILWENTDNCGTRKPRAFRVENETLRNSRNCGIRNHEC